MENFFNAIGNIISGMIIYHFLGDKLLTAIKSAVCQIEVVKNNFNICPPEVEDPPFPKAPTSTTTSTTTTSAPTTTSTTSLPKEDDPIDPFRTTTTLDPNIGTG